MSGKPGDKFSIPISANDIDKDALTLTCAGGYGEKFTDNKNGTGVIEWATSVDTRGKFTFTCMASDGKLNSAPMIFTITLG
jgi:hypothetical protein